jgi:hypothetical protein
MRFKRSAIDGQQAIWDSVELFLGCTPVGFIEDIAPVAIEHKA